MLNTDVFARRADTLNSVLRKNGLLVTLTHKQVGLIPPATYVVCRITDSGKYVVGVGGRPIFELLAEFILLGRGTAEKLVSRLLSEIDYSTVTGNVQLNCTAS